MVARNEATGPWKSPDLEKVDFFIGFVAFGVCNAWFYALVYLLFRHESRVVWTTYLFRP